MGGGYGGLAPPLGSVKSMVSRWVFQVPTGAGTALESKTMFSLPPPVCPEFALKYKLSLPLLFSYIQLLLSVPILLARATVTF